jgi:sensor histidine kinase regulating citrate/malate metabolism
MACGEKISKTFSTKIMTLRVVFQAVAILALIITCFASASSNHTYLTKHLALSLF